MGLVDSLDEVTEVFSHSNHWLNGEWLDKNLPMLNALRQQQL